MEVNGMGNRIKELRVKSGLSTKEFADKLGWCRQMIYRWESEEKRPTLDALIAIASFFNVGLDYLVSGKIEANKDGLTANEYQRLAARTIDKTLNCTQTTYHALHGMVGELGEIHSLYQKTYQGHEYTEEHVMKEFGDLLWFVSEYCTVTGWKLSDIMQMNIDKLRERYPNGFDTDKSLHRKEGDI